MLLVIDNYDSFTYNLVQYLGELGAEPDVRRNDAISLDQIEAVGYERIVISPGPGTPDDAGITLPLIQRFAGRIPILGVCLGHQAIGQVFGGRVVRAPAPVHGKPADIIHDRRTIFAGLPQRFHAGRYHSLIVDRESLPSCLEISATTSDGLIMGLRHRELPVEGVQFHPESVLTSEGKKLLANFLQLQVQRQAHLIEDQAPEGRLLVARHFSGGYESKSDESPVGTTATSTRESLPSLLSRIIRGENLPQCDAAALLDSLLDDATDAQIAAVLVALSLKGETADELAGMAAAMRARAHHLTCRQSCFIDTAGTGASRAKTFNISTAAGFVIAGAGLPVAKHGNRAASSRCGSADLLTALGVRVDVAPEISQRCLDELGICFMFAPLYHSATARVAAVRRQLGIRTIFNLLGPLTNPAGAPRQLLGVSDPSILELMAGALAALGSERAWVVHGDDGLDEITLAGHTRVAEVVHGDVRTFTITSADAGLKVASMDHLRGGDPETNATIIRDVLDGHCRDAARDLVVLNAAAALLIGGRAADLREAVQLAAHSIDSGAAREKLQQLVATTNQPLAEAAVS